MPDARYTRGPVRKEVGDGAHEHTGQRGTPDIPCAMALRLITCSPRSGRARCHRRPGEASASRELDASIGASGPHVFAVRFRAFRQGHLHVHRSPPRVRR